eukprot:CAMPEP_0203869430 /NCGR_PEP_ID=MMETSP0359-20131031/17703_1 /ASSEMBLY_ACC=CAM_ASM_000338 /TAXON_ID=268821 /ORGANISM="Scrippsiella Hangoei, Strain SHTV-5" /LENGTH=610 /DNA_ID=CAMNT_0050788041 /DNA_START=88 /DNA_END=1918 /DNA_ORIENTATION=-
MLVNLPGGLPSHAADPATYCVRAAGLARAAGGDIALAGSPVLWLAPRSPQLSWGRDGHTQELPHAPLWWIGGGWREFPLAQETSRACAHAAYAPRSFEPPWRCGGALLRPMAAPLEPGPGTDTSAAGGPGVVRVLRSLLCQSRSSLWARPDVGGQWRLFPQALEFQLSRTEAFEVLSGDRYVLLLRGSGGSGSLDTVLLFDVMQNAFLPPVSPTRPNCGGHVGEAPVRWRPVDGTWGSSAPGLSLRAWVLESSPEFLLLLAPVCRDGVQRTAEDPHSALHLVGYGGEVVSHHLPCKATRLILQRYDKYFLLVKDPQEHPTGKGGACMDDDWHPSHDRVAAWLLSADDFAVPPLPVMLPGARSAFCMGADSSWSLAIARGSLEELAANYHLRQDTSQRLYLLEDGPTLRLWASRRLDDAFDALYEQHTFDGARLLRHAMDFEPLPQSSVEVGKSAGGSWLLCSPDLRHLARLSCAGTGAGRLAFWRCALNFDGEALSAKASRRRALAAAAVPAETSSFSPGQLLPKASYRDRGGSAWDSCALPSRDARSTLVTGLPCFPTVRREDGTFAKTEAWWIHPISRDAAQLPPLIRSTDAWCHLSGLSSFVVVVWP